MVGNPILVGRLAILSLAPLQWCIVLWYTQCLKAKKFVKRLFAAGVSLSVYYGVIFVQFSIYRHITSISIYCWVNNARRLTDNFVPIVVFR